MNNKEIVYLDDWEYVRIRPEIYVGSVGLTDEKVPYVDNKRIKFKDKHISIGMYKILWEVFDNAIDELVRSKVKNGRIKIEFDSRMNSVSVSDNGKGFHKALDKNPKSGITNIETAVTMLKSGSNLKDKGDQKTVGINGMGVSLTYTLSEMFHINSKNNTSEFSCSWKNFKKFGEKKNTGRYATTGTTVMFIPDKQIFGNAKYDLEFIRTMLSLKKFSADMSNKFDIKFYHTSDSGTELMELHELFDESYFTVPVADGFLAISPLYESSGDMMMINGTISTGSPMKCIQEYVNIIAKNEKAEKYCNVFLFLNLEPQYVKFGDQNKTKYTIHKSKIQDLMDNSFRRKVNKLVDTEIYSKILALMNENENSKDKDLLAKEKKKRKISLKKYFPPSEKKKFLFLVEGDSAKGSILQCRSNDMGVYTLKGKVKNCSKLSDLRNNDEIVDLLTILDLKFGSGDSSYEKIVIAADADPDGYHIVALIYNFFYRWYPEIIKKGKLSVFRVPLMSYKDGNTTKYVYSLSEFEKTRDKIKGKPLYLKGLGALSLEDWEYAMGNLILHKITTDESTLKYLDMAFNSEAVERKNWLNGKV